MDGWNFKALGNIILKASSDDSKLSMKTQQQQT